jgi:hypothetical protein
MFFLLHKVPVLGFIITIFSTTACSAGRRNYRYDKEGQERKARLQKLEFKI